MNTKFYCRESKAGKDGFAAIELSLTIDGKRVFVQLHRKERPADFKKAMDSKRGNDIKEYLDVVRGQVNNAITELTRSGKALTASALKDYIQNGGIKVYTIEDLFRDYRATLSQSNLDSFDVVRDYFFTKVDKSKDVNEITNALIQKCKKDMYLKYEDSTAYGKMMKLKGVIRFALANHKMEIDPFNGIKLNKGREKMEYLTDAEVNTLQATDLSTESLSKIRDLFLFQAGSGLAYVDMANLTKDDIREENGTYYIAKDRCKTGIQYTSVLLPIAIEVLKKYDWTLPIVSSQRINSQLKLIQKECKLGTTLHTHLARKTYCTHLLNNGVRLDVVSKCAGHSNTKITEKLYAHLQRETILREVSGII